MQIKAYKINSFTKNGAGGNPAGVVLNIQNLSSEHMQEIAKKLNFAETAFIKKSNVNNFEIQYFTPNTEVDLCGHATIASICFMSQQKLITNGKYNAETKAGNIEIEMNENESAFMTQINPTFSSEIKDIKEILESLGLNNEDLIKNLPLQIVSTGLTDLIIPVKSLDKLLSIKPDFEKIMEICKKINVLEFHLFSLETVNSNSNAHCRNFAPILAVPEEAATGVANGALSCYLFEKKLITEEQSKNIIIEQGYSMNCPAEICGKLVIKNGEIQKVFIGGKAVLEAEIWLEI